MNRNKRIRLAIVFALFFSPATARAEGPLINLKIVKFKESKGDPKAHNKKEDGRGLYQINPICLKEWNNFHPKERYTPEQLFDPNINERIASWYLEKRIPQMLRHYKKPVTVENVLMAYNGGIGHVVDNTVSKDAKNYAKDYIRLEGR